MSSEWYVQVDGKQFGPYSGAALKQYAADSRITANTQVKKGGNGRWVQAQMVKGLFTPTEPAPPPPPLPEPEPLPKAEPSKVLCSVCGASVLPHTAGQTGGLCRPCSRLPGPRKKSKFATSGWRNRGVLFWATLAVSVWWFMLRPLTSTLWQGRTEARSTSQAYKDGYTEGHSWGVAEDVHARRLRHGKPEISPDDVRQTMRDMETMGGTGFSGVKIPDPYDSGYDDFVDGVLDGCQGR